MNVQQKYHNQMVYSMINKLLEDSVAKLTPEAVRGIYTRTISTAKKRSARSIWSIMIVTDREE